MIFECFWLVWVEDTGGPIMKHLTIEEAQAEAERLARKEAKPVYLLQAAGLCTVSGITWTWPPPQELARIVGHTTALEFSIDKE